MNKYETDNLLGAQRGMLARLASRLRERQMGAGEGVGEDGVGGTIIIDDNCEVSLPFRDGMFLFFVCVLRS